MPQNTSPYGGAILGIGFIDCWRRNCLVVHHRENGLVLVDKNGSASMRCRDHRADGMASRYVGESIEDPLFQPGNVIGKVGTGGAGGIRNRTTFERPTIIGRDKQLEIGLADVENCDPSEVNRQRHCCYLADLPRRLGTAATAIRIPPQIARVRN